MKTKNAILAGLFGIFTLVSAHASRRRVIPTSRKVTHRDSRNRELHFSI